MSTKVNGKITSSMAAESKNCTTVDNIREIGLRAACTGGEFTHGPTDNNTRDNIT